MTPRRLTAAAWVVTLIFALALTGLRALPGAGPGESLENALIDLRFALRGPRPAPEQVLAVAIDDADVAKIGLMTPMRAALAEAVARLTEAGAAAIVIDLLLVEPTPADAALAEALSASPVTVLAVAAAPEAAAASAPLPHVTAAALRRSAFAVTVSSRARGPAEARPLLVPAPPLAVAAGWLGHVNVALSPDRVARRAPLALETAEGAALPSAALTAARLVLGLPDDALALHRGEGVRLGGRWIATDPSGLVLLDHYGGRGTVETVGLGDLLGGRVAAERIAGRAVFVGAGAESLRDVFATPFAADVPGAEVLATLAGNLLGEGPIAVGGPLWALTLALALAAAAAAGTAALAPASGVWAVAATGVAYAATGAALQAAFAGGLALDATAVLGAALAASLLFWPLRLWADRVGFRRLASERATLTAFLSPFASAALPSRGDGPAWRTEAATVAFVDVAGSTALAETLSPAETAAFLAAAQARIAAAAARRGGAVVERLGDGALVAFGFGAGDGGAAEALAFAAELAAPAPGGGPALRVSLQHGPVALADLGGGEWGHVTVAGDTVNVAARLQETAKKAGAAVVAGRAVLVAAGIDPETAGPGLRRLPPETLRGRREPVEVWAVG